MSEVNISNAWSMGERTCFDSLVTFSQSKEGSNAFLGYNPEDRDSWSFSSGGFAVNPIERFWGNSPLWCSLGFRAKVTIRNQDRQQCLEFAGIVLQWLKDTENMKEVSNVQLCRLSDLPQEPTPIVHESGVLVWVCEVPLEMVVSTTTVYS